MSLKTVFEHSVDDQALAFVDRILVNLSQSWALNKILPNMISALETDRPRQSKNHSIQPVISSVPRCYFSSWS